MRQCIFGIIPAAGKHKSVKRAKTYVNISVLQEFIIEILLRKFSIEGQERAVFLCRIRK